MASTRRRGCSDSRRGQTWTPRRPHLLACERRDMRARGGRAGLPLQTAIWLSPPAPDAVSPTASTNAHGEAARRSPPCAGSRSQRGAARRSSAWLHPPTSGRVGRTCGQPRRDARVCFACSQREETERSCGVNSSRTSQVANLRALQYTHVAVSVVARRRRQTHAGTGGEPYRHAARARGASRAGPCARPRRRPCLTHRCRVPANARSVTVKGICRALRRTVHLARGGMFPASSQPARRAGGWPKHRRQRSRPPFSADVQPRARCLASRRARAAAAFARGPFSRWWKPAH